MNGRDSISARARKGIHLVILIALLLAFPAAWDTTSATPSMPDSAITPSGGKIMFNVSPGREADVLASVESATGHPAQPIAGLDGTWTVTLPDDRPADETVRWLRNLPGVVWAEQDQTLRYAFSPGDPLSRDQLWIETIDLPAAWTITVGHPDVIVAVVDSGVSSTHPDLSGKLLPGYDFLNDTDTLTDEVGHGTAVAGIIGARGGDGVGIAGIAMETSILPVKVGSQDGSPISAIAEGIVWAVDQGAHIVNLSLGADFPSETLHQAVRYAYDRGVPVVAAAGNEPEAISYPGAYPETFSVGASTQWGTMTGFTSRTNRVDLVAPGSSVLTTWTDPEKGDTWATVTGTSFAAPMVSGTLALLLALDPALEVEDLRSLLVETAIPVGDTDQEPGAGAGQLDAGAAVSMFLSRAFDNTWRPTDLPVATGATERTWVWGPDPIATGFESYSEAHNGERLIRYYDKARMEITDPTALDADPWSVTNGLLARELITGKMQLGDQTFLERTPAEIVVAGDFGDEASPTYADFAALMNSSPAEPGDVLSNRLTASGEVSSDPRFAQYEVYAAWYIPETNHQIASVFWSYLNSMGLIDMGGELLFGPIFEPTFYATGLPITEAYWTEVRLNGEPTDVLVQCFERRCLTYTPSNPDNWQVEMGNVGQHYFTWRYNGDQPSMRGDRAHSIWRVTTLW